MSYRGGSIPKRLNKQTRKLLSDLDEVAVRGNDKPSNTTVVVHSNPAPGNGPSQPSVVYTEDPTSGTITTIPPAPSGTHRSTRYKNLPTFKEGGNLKLAGPPFSPDANQAIQWVSNGTEWLESNRGPGAETFVPARRYGAKPDTGADMTSKIQKALDQSPAGCILVFEPGTYICNGVNVLRDNMSLCLPPGCVFLSTASTLHASIYVAGTINTAVSKDVVQGPAPDVAYPRGGDRTFYVAAGPDATFFAAGSWISMEDLETVPGGLSPDPDYQFEHHMELVRIKSRDDLGRYDLWSPLVNTYTNVAATAPKLRQVVPIQNFHIWGGGTIQNTNPGVGTAHGIQLFNVIGATIEDISFVDCFDSGLALRRAQEVVVRGCTFRDPPRFDSRGYGITMYGGIRCSVVGNVFKRLRHCVDVSFFSRTVAVSGNTMAGSTTGNINTHACVEGVSITGNVIDGGHGQDAVGPPSIEYGDSNVQSSGINIDVKNKCISIIGNAIRNIRYSGIYIDAGGLTFETEFVDIIGNTIENCMLWRRVTPGGITNHAGIAAQENSAGLTPRKGIVIKGNILREPGPYGIQIGLDGALVEGNWIYKAEDKMRAGVAIVVGIGIWVGPTALGTPTGIIVKNNVCVECKQEGIRVGKNAAATTAGTIIEGNTIRNSGGNGLFIEETCPQTMVRNNWIETSGSDGINTQSASGWYIGNNIRSSTLYGIRLIAGADNNLVKDNLFFNNTSGTINDLGASNFVMFQDDANDRYGIGTATPQQRLEVVGTERLSFSTAAADFTDFTQTDKTGFYGGLTIQPSLNTTALKWIHLFGTDETNALSILDDGTDFFLRTSLGRGMAFNNPTGHYSFLANFGSILEMAGPTGITGAANFFVPSVYKLSDATTNTILTPLIIQRNVTGGVGANGIGARITWSAENTAGTATGMSDWDVVFDTATAGSEDSSIRLVLRTAGATNELVRFDGQNKRVNLHNGSAASPQIMMSCLDAATVFNEQGNDADFRIESDTDANCFFVDAGTDSGAGAVGIGTNAPAGKLAVHYTSGNAALLVESAGGIAALSVFTAATSSGIQVNTGNLYPLIDNTSLLGDESIPKGWKTGYFVGKVKAKGFAASGDTGGTAGELQYVNVIAAVSGATPALLATTGGGPAGATQSHWLKFYDGTTARFIPVWT